MKKQLEKCSNEEMKSFLSSQLESIDIEGNVIEDLETLLKNEIQKCEQIDIENQVNILL